MQKDRSSSPASVSYWLRKKTVYLFLVLSLFLLWFCSLNQFYAVKKKGHTSKAAYASTQPWQVRLSCAAPCQLAAYSASVTSWNHAVNPRQFIIPSEVHPLRSSIFSWQPLNGQTPPSSLATSQPHRLWEPHRCPHGDPSLPSLTTELFHPQENAAENGPISCYKRSCLM